MEHRILCALGLLIVGTACGNADDDGDGTGGGPGTGGDAGTGEGGGGKGGIGGGSGNGGSAGTAGAGGSAGDAGAAGERGEAGTAGGDGEGGDGGHGGAPTGGTSGTAGSGIGGMGGSAGVGRAGAGGTSGAGGGGTAGCAGGAGAGGAGAGGAGAGGAGAGGAGAGGTGGTGCTQAPLPCIMVSPSGNDTTASTTCGTTAFRNVQPAIDYADAHRNVSTNVCVAGGSACVGTSAFGGDLTMRNGISVRGSYEATGWTRCSATTTELHPTLAAGILFGSTVQSPTVLDGFTIVSPALSSTTIVTIDGAVGAELSDLVVRGPSAPVDVRGIDVMNGASAIVSDVSLSLGGATGVAYGVRVVDSFVSLESSDIRPALAENATGYGVWLENASGSRVVDTTVGVGSGPQAALTTAIRILGGSDIEIVGGKAYAENASVEQYGIDLTDATGVTVTNTRLDARRGSTAVGVRAVGSLVHISGVILDANASTAVGVMLDESPGSSVAGGRVRALGDLPTGVVLTGDGTGVEIGGQIDVRGDSPLGILAQDCADAEPEIYTQVSVSAPSGADAEGIRALGTCHPRIGATVSVAGTNAANVVGVTCGASGGIASRCSITRSNISVEISRLGPSQNSRTVGVSCEQGGCEEISDTGIGGPTQSGSSCFRSCGTTAFGIVLDSTDTLVARNGVSSGCGDSAAAISAAASTSRVENNLLVGSECSNPLEDNYLYSTGIRVQGGALDVHSNTIYAGGSPNVVFGSCTSAAVMGGTGSYRNNIFRSGECAVRSGFARCTLNPQTCGSSQARENNLHPDVDPLFVDGLHLGPGSPCIDSGTPTGAPVDDIDGMPRSATRPDIGADEWGDLPDPCIGVTCAGHGTCVPAGGGQASCDCDEGYENPASDPLSCQAIPDPCDGVTCSGHGTCVPGGDGQASCDCDEGYEAPVNDPLSCG